MRTKGKGQRIDHLWRALNNLFDIYWHGSREILADINALQEKARKVEPWTDYETKDRANLLDQIELLKIREIQKEKENRA